jgi:hypothetical protein
MTYLHIEKINLTRISLHKQKAMQEDLRIKIAKQIEKRFLKLGNDF